MNHLSTITALLIILMMPAGPLSAQETESREFSAEDIQFFEKKIRPLLIRRCYECHSRKADKLRGGLKLDDYASVLEGGDTGPAVVVGDPEQSLLIEAINYKSDSIEMPPDGKMPKNEIALLVKWVELGIPFPTTKTRPSSTAAAKGIDVEQGRKFWSFQSVRLQPLPETKHGGWQKRRIDAFIASRLEQHQLAPSVVAGRRTLIRRVKFDLVGLPPSLDEVEQFVDDERPDAYERLIDRLLASPHYGERWGRYWLDLARYTDSTASWLNSVGQAFLYRDWVVGAFNEDMAYEDFVRRQLATDMMSETGPDDLAALGFVGLSPTYWKELRLDHNVIKGVVADEYEERIDALGRTFLGLTLACARCHDHKFDPVRNEDYYALAGVFASTRLTDRFLLPPAEAAIVKKAHKQVAALEAEMKKLRTKKPVSDASKKRVAELRDQIAAIQQSTPSFNAPVAHAVDDASLYVLPVNNDLTKLEYKPGKPRDLPIAIRGNPAKPGAIVPRGFLAVLSSGKPRRFKNGSGRLELADAIVRDAAPLAARVIVNRIWKQHFGAGLVDTPSDFGTQGARPSHPDLLDDLATRFIEHGWSIKWLHREILLSAAYQQSSAHDEAKFAIDPDNRWLWRMNRRRLDIEAWRDAMLFVAGRLDRTIGGPPVALADAKSNRRTIYGKIERRELDGMLRLHDFPIPTGHSPSREITVTPLQQLFVMNSEFIQERSREFAHRLAMRHDSDMEAKIGHAYEILYSRPVTKSEFALATEFLSQKHGKQSDESWRQYAQILLGSNEFLFVD